jgi:hypothetical protein
MVLLVILAGMKTEKELNCEYGWDIAEMKCVRKQIINFDSQELWTRLESKKPEHLRTVVWTDFGVEYLKAWFEGVREADKLIAYLGKNPVESGRLEEVVVHNDIRDLWNSQWVGKVTKNWFPNDRIMEVQHENGLLVIVYVRNSKSYRIGDKVLVDSQRVSHYVRGGAIK